MFFFEKEPVSLYLEGLKEVITYKSTKQNVNLYLHDWLGKILVINGEIQHIENYQPFYHEILVHLPTALIPDLKSVLIIGGGSLFAAYEALKYPSVERVVLCDYDHSVLALMQQQYEHARIVLNNNKFHYIEQDAHQFLHTHKNKYDLIINDCFNMAIESKRHNTSYYKLFSDLTTPNGVCSDIIYRHIFDLQTTIDSMNLLQTEKYYKTALSVVPEYPGILHLQTIWGNTEHLRGYIKVPLNKIQREYISKPNSKIEYNIYSPEHLSFYFHVPLYIKKLFDKV